MQGIPFIMSASNNFFLSGANACSQGNLILSLKNFWAVAASSSMEILMNRVFSPFARLYSFSSPGSSSIQGLHQVAQISIKVYLLLSHPGAITLAVLSRRRKESCGNAFPTFRTAMQNTTPQIADQYRRPMLKTMITDSLNIDRAFAWGQKSDMRTGAQAMYEMYTTDIRDSLVAIRFRYLFWDRGFSIAHMAQQENRHRQSLTDNSLTSKIRIYMKPIMPNIL
jgi:hypothetical protein